MFCYPCDFITLGQMGLVRPLSTRHQYNLSSLVIDLLHNSSGSLIGQWKTPSLSYSETKLKLRGAITCIWTSHLSCQENVHPY